MNLRYITLAFLSFVGLFSSCNSDSEYDLSTASKDAQISSFSLTGIHNKTLTDSLERATDSVRFVTLGKTRFAIDQVNNIIYNPDSLPFGFTLKTLLPAIKYNGSPYSLTVELRDALKENGRDTTYQWNGSDSINLAYKIVQFKVIAANQATEKVYKIDIRIHKIDPDLMTWSTAASYSEYADYRKSVLTGDSITTLTKSLASGYVLEVVSETRKNPSQASIKKKNVSGLPTDIDVSSFIFVGGGFYVSSQDGKVYESSDGEVWSQKYAGDKVKAILGIAPGNSDSENRIVTLVEKDSKIHFGVTTDFSNIEVLSSIPSGFPVKGFASTSVLTGIKTRRIMFVGTGLTSGGEELNTVWWLKMDGGSLSVIKGGSSTLFSGTGNSLFFYDDKLYLYSKTKFYTSSTWGTLWVEGAEKQALPTTGTGVKNYAEQSVVVKNNTVWILGGKTQGASYHDAETIWTATLNRLK